MNPTNFKQSCGLKLLACLVIVLTLGANSVTTRAAVVAHWTFDETSGSVAHDTAGPFDGSLSPSGAAFVSGGVSGNALSLDKAANGFVNMGNVLGLTSGDFSIVAWAKMSPGDRTDTSLILGKQAAGSRNGYFLNVNKTGGRLVDDKAAFYEGGVGVAPITIAETPISTTSVNDGNWHQIVAVYQAGANKSIYVDGAPAEDVKPSQSFVGNSVAFLIGGLNFGGIPAGQFTGLIDDVQIYNHALSDGDIDFLYQHPGQVALDCSQQLAAAQAQLAAANAANAALQAQLTAANQHNQELQDEIVALLLPLQVLTHDWQAMFRQPSFQIPGVNAVQQMQNLIGGVEALNYGQQQALFYNLGGRKK